VKRAVRSLVTALIVSTLVFTGKAARAEPKVVIGSKAFPESWILGDALLELVQRSGAATAEHRKNLGGTEIAYQALLSGSIDVYPEYSGTISEVILKDKGQRSLEQLRSALSKVGVAVSESLGFNDGYALAVTARTAARHGLKKISDLSLHPDLRLGLTHEFLGRSDGYPGLTNRYGLAMNDVRGLQHELAYEAMAKGQIDVTDIYTTDPQIEQLSLVLLDDDRSFFPRYDAVLLYRLDLTKRAPGALEAMARLVGKIDERAMMHANAAVALRKSTTEEAARMLLSDAREASPATRVRSRGVAAQIGRNVVRHLELVGASLFFAILLGIPLGIVATRSRSIAFLTLTSAGLLQTIPSLALLAFLIPLFGIGIVPALIALFIYSLLPIVRNTFTGLTSIPSSLDEAADGIGLSKSTKLWRVGLPMASPAVVAGIKTSAIINVGTATLAALIGAEGLGNPIMQGIALRDTSLILQGAIPAALLALFVEASFYLVERAVVPKGLRLSSGGR
jgi:osmoprotectant transport system permease protein